MDALHALSIRDFLQRLGDKTPAPGGGAAACMTGATAAALARMVVEYSLGKKSLAEHQPALQRARDALARFAEVFLELADEDAAAYALVDELGRLPETDERRRRDYPAAAAAAVAAPRAALAASADLLRLAEQLAPITNRHLRSDLAIAAVLAEGAARSAWWNVSINLPLITSEADRQAVAADGVRLCADARVRRDAVEIACAA